MDTRRVQTEYPCCKGRAWFDRIYDVPRQRYDRTCPRCNAKWTVDLTTRRRTNALTIDIAEWMPEAIP